MFQQAGTAQLNDYFRPLSERGGSRVFFCRIAGYGETVAAFLRRYYEAARRSGVIIDGRMAADGTLAEVAGGRALEDAFFDLYAARAGEAS